MKVLAWRGVGNGYAQTETVTLTLPLRGRPRRASLECSSTAETTPFTPGLGDPILGQLRYRVPDNFWQGGLSPL